MRQIGKISIPISDRAHTTVIILEAVDNLLFITKLLNLKNQEAGKQRTRLTEPASTPGS
jgi:hypothetical protein